MRHYLLTFLLCLISLPAAAVYRCESRTGTSYADSPCANEVSIDISEQVRDPVLPGDAALAQQRAKRQKQEIARIEKERNAEIEAASKARRQFSRKAATKEKECQALALRVKWAEEDLAAANGRLRASAQRKAKRVAEKHALACPAAPRSGLL